MSCNIRLCLQNDSRCNNSGLILKAITEFMNMVPNKIFVELLWLVSSSIFTLLLSFLFFGRQVINHTIDIAFYDTYFVIEPIYILLPIFLLIIFVIYFAKEYRNSFARQLPNWILIIDGIALVITLTYLIIQFSGITNTGWTLYPPLSALGPDKVQELAQDHGSQIISVILSILQIFVISLLIFAAYRWGNRKFQ